MHTDTTRNHFYYHLVAVLLCHFVLSATTISLWSWMWMIHILQMEGLFLWETEEFSNGLTPLGSGSVVEHYVRHPPHSSQLRKSCKGWATSWFATCVVLCCSIWTCCLDSSPWPLPHQHLTHLHFIQDNNMSLDCSACTAFSTSWCICNDSILTLLLFFSKPV